MFASKHPKLTNNQLAEVICELRFPKILAITTSVPDMFQEAIRDVFPIYKKQAEQEKVTMHQFFTVDQKYRIHLTSSHIALICSEYESWNRFSAMLDKPLAAFIRIYRPAFFERIGLRYLNFISRKHLHLEDVAFRELIAPAYLGLLNLSDVDEKTTARSSVDCDIALDENCRLGCHAGTGMVSKAGVNDPEVKFILDFDFYTQGQIPVKLSAGAMQTLHDKAYPTFEAAVTQTLLEALQA